MENTALIFISHHPSCLPKYDYIRRVHKDHLSILIFCSHPYLNSEIIGLYSKKFDHVIIMPIVEYERNIFRAGLKLYKFLESFRRQVIPILNTVEDFFVFSNFSAYLPVNALLSRLSRKKKCRLLVGLSETPNFKVEINVLVTLYLQLLIVPFRLWRVYYHKKLSYLYLIEPRRRNLRFVNRFVGSPDLRTHDAKGNPVYNVFEPVVERGALKKDIVLIYGDCTVYEVYGCSLSSEIYAAKLALFFNHLSEHYKECRIIYKPHPSDQSKVMPGLEYIKYELYNGILVSEMHLEQNIHRVKACYSVASTCLLYSALKGIPSYTLYRYLEFDSECPRTFFENENVCENPFLYHIKLVDEIGAIDSINVSPVENDYGDDWSELLS